MNNDYDNLPFGTKLRKLIAGIIPPIATWQATGSIWYAAAVFVIGFVGGYFVSSMYDSYLIRDAQRDTEGRILPSDWERFKRQSLPVFLWAPPICGTIAAIGIVWFKNSN